MLVIPEIPLSTDNGDVNVGLAPCGGASAPGGAVLGGIRPAGKHERSVWELQGLCPTTPEKLLGGV